MKTNNGIDLGSGGSSGYIDQTIGASVYLSTDYTITASDSWEDLPLDSEDWDFGGDFNTSTGAFTVPVSGYYRISGQARFSWENNGDEPVSVGAKIDGTHIMVTAYTIVGAVAAEPTAILHKVVYLNKDEVLTFCVLHGDTADVKSSSTKTWFQIEYLGS